jgi:hypothetical protein
LSTRFVTATAWFAAVRTNDDKLQLLLYVNPAHGSSAASKNGTILWIASNTNKAAKIVAAFLSLFVQQIALPGRACLDPIFGLGLAYTAELTRLAHLQRNTSMCG